MRERVSQGSWCERESHKEVGERERGLTRKLVREKESHEEVGERERESNKEVGERESLTRKLVLERVSQGSW